MGEAKRRKLSLAQVEKMTHGEVLAQCPYQSLIGFNIPPGITRKAAFDAVSHRISCVVAVLDGEPWPLSQQMLTDVLLALLRGEVVLLASNRADLRDCAKREIYALEGGPGWMVVPQAASSA